ncbi:MAG: MerR family transcriptional regulator [Chloroflexi bacterium]|nr:MerR family transcriptional regulator [Chloroflexota bacterium]
MSNDDEKTRSGHPAHTPRYVISVVSRLVDVPAHTLRTYDRLGLLSPARTGGGTRLYSDVDVWRIRRIVELTRQGVNLAGVKVILEMETTRSEQQDEHGATVTRTRALIKLRTEIIPRE